MTALHIPKPCHENWDEMTPQERGRHCQVCDKTVVDVTRMQPMEGRRFLGKLRDDLAAGAHVCVRVHADAAGRLLAPSATRRLLTNGLAAVLAVAVAGCSGTGPQVSQAQQAQPQQAQPLVKQPQNPQPTQTTGEPVATGECLQGDVAVMPQPKPQPQPQPMMGAPAPQPVEMGRVVAQPHVIKGEVEAPVVQAPRDIQGKVVAVQPRELMGKPVAPK